MPIEQSALDVIALSRTEYDLIVERLGREPNEVELGMFGALWSEHCGYKNSKPLLRLLPAEGAYVLTKRGAENAGAVDIGDGLCVVMKIESHNHPSAIEPYQGAATGVGGIVRDIFAMGARPIALLDSLRFGPIAPDDPKLAPTGLERPYARNRYLFEGVVAGIGGYGNCLGIPTVGGELVFEDSYTANPLVNAMCVGVAPVDRLASATAEGVGNLLMLVGADTGRDGIHGASGLASRTDPNARFDELRPAVQVGNPFLEKMLMEACLDLARNHSEWIVGIQDLGAAGLTSSSVESAARAGSGLVIDVGKMPRREEGMTPYELMLSESQERMLIIARKEHEADVAKLMERWEVPWTVIGHVTADQAMRIVDGDREVGVMPVDILVEAPEYTRDGKMPAEMAVMHEFDPATLPDIAPDDANGVLLKLLGSANIASKRWVYRQYDQSVLDNTVTEAGSDAAVLRIKGSAKGIAVATDGNGRYCHIDPYLGGAIAVAEAARNVVCVGALPVAVTDCLNFGNPERPEVYFQMEGVIRGIADACGELGTPVISGNVSLYNETGEQAVYPTPVIGMLGILDDVTQHFRPAVTNVGDDVFVVGQPVDQPAGTLAGSEFMKLVHGMVAGLVSIDLQLEGRCHRAALAAMRQGIVTAAHDCSDGGMAVVLAEMCMAGDKGIEAPGVTLGRREDAALFGEGQSRIVLALRPGSRERLGEIANGLDVPIQYIGTVIEEPRLRFGPIDLALDEMRDVYDNALPNALRSAAQAPA